MSVEFIQIPPDSTGKKIRHQSVYDVEVSNVIGDVSTLDIGDIIQGVTSQTTANFFGTSTIYGVTTLHIDNVQGTFQLGEDITIGGVVTATISSIDRAYTPIIHIADKNTPAYTQKVDRLGNSFVRFKDGEQTFDAFGRQQSTIPFTLESHTSTYGNNLLKFWDNVANGGTIEDSTVDSTSVLTTSGLSGSIASRTSHVYYPYTPGVGTELITSAMIGDAGKNGVVRRWGLFDDTDGVFFQLDGTQLSVVIRNSSSGTVEDIVINQENWNRDQLLSAENDAFVLDPSKFNLWWIDYSWHGVGSIRFGVFSPAGSRVVCHVYENPNSLVTGHTSRGSHPYRIEQRNKTEVGSSSQIKYIAGTIISSKLDRSNLYQIN